MAAGYEDLDILENKQNNLLNQQEQKQNDVINQQTQMQVDELNREKEKLDKDTQKTTSGLYSSWQKQANQYGAGMEQLAQQGLANSGYAESTRTSLYNTYQKSVTDTLNNSRDLKADYDFKITQARQNGSVQQAQAALDLYSQRLQLLTQNYELRQNREQYLYQQERDRVSDSQWQKTFDEQVRQNELENQWKQKQFDYQKQRDTVSDSQWEKQYALSKKASSRSSRSSRSTSSKKKSSEGLKVNNSNGNTSMQTNNNAEQTKDSSFGMIAEKILNFSQPNSQGRKIMLQGLVKAGTLTQEQSDKLVSAK